MCYILHLTYSTTKRKVGSNRDQLTPFSALLDPPDSSETYSSTTKVKGVCVAISLVIIGVC